MVDRSGPSVLSVAGLNAHYGDFQALFDVNFDLGEGEVLAIIGANGAGKSTLLKSIVGLIGAAAGTIVHRGEPIGDWPADKVVARGIALVPEGRRLFPSLSVEENLLIGGQIQRPGAWSLDTVYDLFPVLKEKRHDPSTDLSGGQQQMVAIGRALMANPELLLFDELSLGLAPVIINDIYAALPDVIASGAGAILVEQDISRALSICDRVICLQEGRVSLQGEPAQFTRGEITQAYFGA